jgi:hypothetical protein
MQHRFDKEADGPVHPDVLRVRGHIRAVVAGTAPVECVGPAGSLVLWHHRLMHSASRRYNALGVPFGSLSES